MGQAHSYHTQFVWPIPGMRMVSLFLWNSLSQSLNHYLTEITVSLNYWLT